MLNHTSLFLFFAVMKFVRNIPNEVPNSSFLHFPTVLFPVMPLRFRPVLPSLVRLLPFVLVRV